LLKSRLGPFGSPQAASSQLPDDTLYLTVVTLVKPKPSLTGSAFEDRIKQSPVSKGKTPGKGVKSRFIDDDLFVVHTKPGTLDYGMMAFTGCGEKAGFLLANLPEGACIAGFAFRFLAAP